MALQLDQIKELIKDRPRKREIARGIAHQNRLKFHSETALLKSELSAYRDEFISWIAAEKPELLPKDKIERFKQLMTCPLPTNQLTQAIAISLSRAFEGQDRFFRYDFKDEEIEDDWENYRDDEFWAHDGLHAMMMSIDSVWVVDLPSEQEGDKPEPKNMLIDISDVIDISVKKDGTCNYVIFSIGEKLFIYDDTSIQVYTYKDNIIGDEIAIFAHEVGYCPASMFWSDLLMEGNWINHKAPITNVLSELDWLLVHKIFKKYMDIGNSFPILVKYQSDQNYSDLTPADNSGRTEGEQKTDGGEFVGPGSIMQVPMPNEGQPDLMSNPLAWISPPVETLKFHVEEDVRLSDYIYKTSVGIDGEQSNDQAKNEKQVLASFENQSIILRRVARNFERIQAFADQVIIKMRYGVDIEASIDYGDRFFLKTAEDIMDEKESVAGDDVLTDAVNRELIEAKFRNDSAGKQRISVINDLDPLPNKSLDEVIKIYNAKGITKEQFIIKINLMSFVNRFEREQLPISKMLQTMEYVDFINLITNEFKKYYEEFNQGELRSISGDKGRGSSLLPRQDGNEEDDTIRSDQPDSEDGSETV